MDTLSHALWGGGLFGYRKYRWVAIFFGVIPDLLSFGVLFLIKFVSGELNYSGLPTLESLLQLRPIPEWVFIMDNFTHSFVTSFLFIAIVYFLKPQLVWPILAWPFHILLDFAFHTKDLFPVQLFWPITDYYVDGVSWSHPLVWFSNAAGIVILFLYRWATKEQKL